MNKLYRPCRIGGSDRLLTCSCIPSLIQIARDVDENVKKKKILRGTSIVIIVKKSRSLARALAGKHM